MSDLATRLVEACAHGDHGTAKHLIEAEGTDVNMPNTRGVLPLLEAARNGSMVLVKLLVDNGANVNGTSQYTYVSRFTMPGKTSIHELPSALPKGTAIRGDLVDNHIRTSFDTPLFVAVQNRHIDVAKYLIENGANVNVKRDDGYTPFVESSR